MALTGRPEVIYGLDDRRDYYQVGDLAVQLLADSTVALIKRNKLMDDGDIFKISSETLGEKGNLCPSEPFFDQPTAAFCSGFLVAPNIIVTAAHCLENQKKCDSAAFVFGFSLKPDIPTTMAKDDVYYCKKILDRRKERKGADWAVIELDREVTDHTPLTFRTEGQITKGTPLIVIGHPSGLPTKIADNAAVRSVSGEGFFVANLDTYGGNSGSAIFNQNTHEVEGILVRGDTDYQDNNGCQVSKKCPDSGCRGEDVTLITEVCLVNGKPCN